MTRIGGSIGALTLAVLTLVLAGPAQSAKSRGDERGESEARMKKDIFFLASPLCEGRGPTTKGINLAADYIAAEFKKIGLKPGFKGGYFQPFTIPGAEATLALDGPAGRRSP